MEHAAFSLLMAGFSAHINVRKQKFKGGWREDFNIF
jgi:hypothetical protein